MSIRSTTENEASVTAQIWKARCSSQCFTTSQLIKKTQWSTMQNPGRVKAWNSLAAYLCAKALGEEVRDKICKFSGAAEQQYKHKSSQRCRICGALSPEQRRERATGKHGQAHLCVLQKKGTCAPPPAGTAVYRAGAQPAGPSPLPRSTDFSTKRVAASQE